MLLIRRLIVIMLMTMPTLALAQVDDAIEQWIDERGSDADASELSDILLQYADHPANLNDTASLSSVPFLSPFQIKALRNYIILYGQLLSVKELLMVPGFDSLSVSRIAPLVTAEPFEEHRFPSLGEMLSHGHHTLVTGLGGTVEQAHGYDNGHYDGDNLRALFCYRFAYGNHVALQLSGDKDPTEPWGKGNFYGYSLTLNNIGRLEKLVFGRYNLQFGQGVTLWTGFSPFALLGASPVRYATGIRAASAFYEEGWQQGLAATVRLARGLDVSAFASRTDGEWLGGAHATYRRGNLILGLTAAAAFLDDSLQLHDYAYNQDYFRGDRAATFGLDALWQAGRTLLFGEAAIDASGRVAAMGGARLTLGGGNSIGLTLRHYDPLYHNLHADAYSLGATRNEQGVGLDAQLQLPFRLTALLAADLHRFPSLRYGSYAPSAGSWLRMQLGRPLGRHAEVALRYALRVQQRNVPGSDSIAYLAEETLRSLLQGQVRLSYGPWRFNTRVVLSWFDAEQAARQHGWLLSQEARYIQGRWQAALQATWHNIGGYYARITLSESNLQYAFSIPSLQGRGLRASAVVRCNVSQWLNLGVKYTLMGRPGEASLGSGDAATDGPVRQTWHFQAKVHFYPPPIPPETLSDRYLIRHILYCFYIVLILFLYCSYIQDIRTICKQYVNYIRTI